MLTDAPSRKNRTGFLESDRIKTLDIPPNRDLLDIAKQLEYAMKAGSIRQVRSASIEFVKNASNFYKVSSLRHPRTGSQTSAGSRARNV